MTFEPLKFVSVMANCNSSSSHAMIGKGSRVPVHRDMTYFGRSGAHKLETKAQKMHYLNAQVNGAGSTELILGFMDKFPKWKYNPNSYIDHQSQIRCPMRAYYGGVYAWEMILQVFDLILEDDIDILVVGDEYPETEVGRDIERVSLNRIFNALTFGDMIAQEVDDFSWVLYPSPNAQVGFYPIEKMVIHTKPGLKSKPYTCDMKITDMCFGGCKWCYQNSKYDGEHAKYEDVAEFVVQHPHIVEYALGGGEPTLHPDFSKIIDFMRNQDKLVNFTTKCTDIPDTKATGVALSADSCLEAVYMAGVLHKLSVSMARHIHMIAWPHSMVELSENLDRILDQTNNTSKIVLLAPKLHTNPNAKKYWKQSLRKGGGRLAYDHAMIKILNHYRSRFCVAIDTPLMRDYKEYIDFDPMYHFTEEGEFSMYHDAVTGKSYKSSYELDKEL